MNCIQQNIKTLIYNKHGFVTRLQRLFSIRVSISLIHFIDLKKQKYECLSKCKFNTHYWLKKRKKLLVIE